MKYPSKRAAHAQVQLDPWQNREGSTTPPTSIPTICGMSSATPRRKWPATWNRRQSRTSEKGANGYVRAERIGGVGGARLGQVAKGLFVVERGARGTSVAHHTALAPRERQALATSARQPRAAANGGTMADAHACLSARENHTIRQVHELRPCGQAPSTPTAPSVGSERPTKRRRRT